MKTKLVINSLMVLSRSIALTCFSFVIAVATIGSASAQQTTGNTARGETFFTSTYKCYACHGFDAQTGARRLKPMRYTEAAFTTFVQNSPLAQMPAYPDVAADDLADIYAYVLSIPIDAPAIDEIPLLKEIRDAKLESLAQ